MQLQDFARQVLVEAAIAIAPGARVRADGHLVVEIDQHRRMHLDRAQHVGETAQHMRADRLALERPGEHAQRVALARRDGEMIGPEHHEPLEQPVVRCRETAEARRGLGPEQRDLGRRRGRLHRSLHGRSGHPARLPSPRHAAAIGHSADMPPRHAPAHAACRLGGRSEAGHAGALGLAAEFHHAHGAQRGVARHQRGVERHDGPDDLVAHEPARVRRRLRRVAGASRQARSGSAQRGS